MSSQVNSDQGDIKLDWRPNERDYFSSRYSNGRQDQPTFSSFPLFYNTFNIAPFQNGVINWTRTISPTLVNEARFGVNNIMLDNGGADKGLGDIGTKLGISNAGAGLCRCRGLRTPTRSATRTSVRSSYSPILLTTMRITLL